MADLIFPNAFVRQFSGPLDKDQVFSTTAELTSYLTNPRRYPGQIVYDVQAKTVYVLNETASAWQPAFGSTFSSLTGLSAYTPPADATFTSSVSAPALSGTFYGDGSRLTGIIASGGIAVDSSKLPLTGGILTGDLTIFGSITALSGATFVNTVFTTTSALSVVNTGAGPALYVYQGPGSGDVASFYDGDGIEVLHIGNGITSGLGGVIGIQTSAPNKTLTVAGEVSATRGIWASTFYGDGSGLTGLSSYTPPADATFTSSVSAPALSGTFYGDGSRLTGLSSYTPPADATFTSSVSAPALSGTFYGDGSRLTGLSSYTPPANATFTSSVSAPALSGTFYGDGSRLTGIASLSAAVFASDLTVSLPGGKTFGRYNSGDIIPAAGKTPAEVIQMAIAAPITPTVSLTSPTTIAFNQTNISNVLNFSHVINSLGATVASASLEWRRNNTGSWTQLTTSTASTSSYTHTLTDTNFNIAPFNYRYTVTDSAGATATATRDITPAGYSAPTMSITVAAQTLTSPESNSSREKGNIASTLSGSISRNSSNTTLASYVIQFRINNGSYTDIGAPVVISGSSASFSGISHTPAGASAADSVSYRISVTDNYTTSAGSASTINFNYLIFYGPSSTAPTNSSTVRALGTRSFTNTLSNPFILNSGTTDTKFSVAMPSTLAITLAQDLDASNATLTNNYINNPFNVNDGGGNAVSYNVYTLSIATPYSPSHRHQITRA